MNGSATIAAPHGTQLSHDAIEFWLTGAGGWIGRDLYETLRAEAIKVHRIMRSDFEAIGEGRSPQIEHEITRFRMGGQSSEASMQPDQETAAKKKATRVLVHLAGLAHQPQGISDETIFRVNTEWTLRLAEWAAQQGFDRFVFVSSAKVNGDSNALLGRPFKESDPAAPSDVYASAKAQAERGLLEAQASWRDRDLAMDLVIIRPPLVWGAKPKANFAQLLRWARSPWPLPLAGASAPRSMVHRSNLISAIRFLSLEERASGQVCFVADVQFNDALRPQASHAAPQQASTAAVAHAYPYSTSAWIQDLRALHGRPPGLFKLSRSWLERALSPLTLLAWSKPSLNPSAITARLFEPMEIDPSKLWTMGWRPVMTDHLAQAKRDFFLIEHISPR